MRFEFGQGLCLEQENNIWYLSSARPGEIAWKADIASVAAEWKALCSCGDPKQRVSGLETQIKREPIIRITDYMHLEQVRNEWRLFWSGVYEFWNVDMHTLARLWREDAVRRTLVSLYREGDSEARSQEEFSRTRDALLLRIKDLEESKDLEIAELKARIKDLEARITKLPEHVFVEDEMRLKVGDALYVPVHALVETYIKREPTFDEWVERIKSSKNLAVELARKKVGNQDGVVWACLMNDQPNYIPRWEMETLLDLPHIHGITNQWEVYRMDEARTQVSRMCLEHLRPKKPE